MSFKDFMTVFARGVQANWGYRRTGRRLNHYVLKHRCRSSLVTKANQILFRRTNEKTWQHVIYLLEPELFF